MPGLIDAHCHVSYGIPRSRAGQRQGTTRPEFSTLKSARSVQKVLRSGVTSISVPGGHLVHRRRRARRHQARPDGRAAHVRRRPHDRHLWLHRGRRAVVEGTPDHSIGKLCNTADEMVTEVRRQGKHGVNFIKMADSRGGESQMLAKDEISAVVGEAASPQPARRDSLPRRRLDPRGGGSRSRLDHPRRPRHRTAISRRSPRAACRSSPPPPSSPRWSSSVRKVGAEQVQLDITRMKRHFDLLCELMHKARKLGHQAAGRHRYRQQRVHALRRAARQGARDLRQIWRLYADGGDRRGDPRQRLRGRPRRPGRRARAGSSPTSSCSTRNPIADITVLQGGKHLSWVIKDGRVVDLGPRDEMLTFQQAAE